MGEGELRLEKLKPLGLYEAATTSSLHHSVHMIKLLE